MERSQAVGDDWGRLTPEERVRAVFRTVADGVTAVPEQVCGLADTAITEVEKDQEAPITNAYRCFLATAGAGAGHFLQGSDVFHPQVLGLWTAARDLLEENRSPFELTPADRVILMHQGYQFDFLRGDHDDPEVWSYCEIDNPGNAPAHSHDRFTDWLKSHAEEQTAAWARLLPWSNG
jgi:hypothetical protein